MILDLRYAAGLPVNAGAIVGFAFGLFQYVRKPDKPALWPIWALYQAFGVLFFGAMASLLFVLPNVGAAAMSNHIAADAPWFVYGLSFAAICTAVFCLQMKLLDKFFRTLGGMKTSLADPRTLALIGGNIALCLLFAAFVPMQELPHV